MSLLNRLAIIILRAVMSTLGRNKPICDMFNRNRPICDMFKKLQALSAVLH